MRNLLWNLLVLLFLPLFFFAAILPKRKKYFVWGSAPLISNKYWSEALKQLNIQSITIMQCFYKINKKSDYDLYIEDFAPKYLPRIIRMGIGTCLALLFVLRKARVVHISYLGFALGSSIFWRLESFFLKIGGVKVIVTPYGSDAYMYSKIIDPSLRYGLLASYPNLARLEDKTEKYVRHWNRHADIIIAGLMIDGIGRWDVTMNQIFCINIQNWQSKTTYSKHDGINGLVRIIHTPNHRGFKGTEFLLDAVEQLKKEGLKIELILLEGVPNEKVRELMQTADILGEQFIATGYALSGIEGMASGLPVLANLEHEAYTRVFRRYGFLNECPILSTSPESLVNNLKVLIKNPILREELGRAGRAYVEKYHSYETAQYLFGSIYNKILYGNDIDLINLFHPLKSEFNKSKPYIQHPLVENKLPNNSWQC